MVNLRNAFDIEMKSQVQMTEMMHLVDDQMVHQTSTIEALTSKLVKELKESSSSLKRTKET